MPLWFPRPPSPPPPSFRSQVPHAPRLPRPWVPAPFAPAPSHPLIPAPSAPGPFGPRLPRALQGGLPRRQLRAAPGAGCCFSPGRDPAEAADHCPNSQPRASLLPAAGTGPRPPASLVPGSSLPGTGPGAQARWVGSRAHALKGLRTCNRVSGQKRCANNAFP